MAFMVGQQVRVKCGPSNGVVAKKLAFLEDMYVIELDGNHTPPRKLAHESDLELRIDERRTA